MAINRLEHTEGYTVIDNGVIRNKQLSAMEKVILEVCLSLPKDWKYNIRGLCTFVKEGPDAVSKALHGLESKGYIVRRRTRENGKITGMEYDIFESPQMRKNPVAAAPERENPEKAEPGLGEQGLPIKEIQIKDKQITDLTKDLSTNQTDGWVEKIREQIEYEIMCQRYDRRLLDDIVAVMVSVYMLSTDQISVGRDAVYPAEYVRRCLEKINPLHIELLLESLIETRPQIHNIRAYLLSALINTANSMEFGYAFGTC